MTFELRWRIMVGIPQIRIFFNFFFNSDEFFIGAALCAMLLGLIPWTEMKS